MIGFIEIGENSSKGSRSRNVGWGRSFLKNGVGAEEGSWSRLKGDMLLFDDFLVS